MTVALLAALTGLAVLAGSAVQRLTGMGFALVASPPIVLLLGATSGVALLQVLGLVASGIVLAATFRDASWRKALGLAIPALLGMIPGWFIARTVPGPILLILIGLLIIVAITAMLADDRARIFKGTGGMIGAGVLSGFMQVLASVGGPAIVLYKLSTNWSHRQFVGTIQLYFIAISIGALFALGWPPLPAPVWISTVAGMFGGLILGQRLTSRATERTAARLVIVVALMGAATILIQGMLQLL